jgi:hypothetical protein
MINEYEAVGEMRIGRGRVLGEILPLYAPKIQHDVTWDRTQAAAVGTW